MSHPLQISYVTIGGLAGEKPAEQAMKDAQLMGFDGVEFAFGVGEFVPGMLEDECARLRRVAEGMGMPLRTLATGEYWTQSLADPREAVRREAIAFTREYLCVAALLGVKTILVIPGHVAVPWDAAQPVIPYAQAWELASESLRACLSLAESLGVTMALENVWNWFLADPIAMRTFVDQFSSEYLGVYFDAGNVLINGYPEHWVDILGARIKAVHVKNFTRADCGGGLHGFGDDLAKGDLDWKAFGEALTRNGYAGPVTAEMIPFSRMPDLGLPDMALARKTAQAMKTLLPDR